MKTITSQLDWQKDKGLIPAIIQDSNTQQVLMLAYMNEEAFEKTQATNEVWFWSRSKQRLWKKGETSGNVLRVRSIQVDCDQDTILIMAEPVGPTCHTGSVSCLTNDRKFNAFEVLFGIIKSRKKSMPKGSYTASLFQKGQGEICSKIDEEAAEVIQAAEKEGNQRLIEESVDLIYHLFVLLISSGINLDEIFDEIKRRMKP